MIKDHPISQNQGIEMFPVFGEMDGEGRVHPATRAGADPNHRFSWLPKNSCHSCNMLVWFLKATAQFTVLILPKRTYVLHKSSDLMI